MHNIAGQYRRGRQRGPEAPLLEIIGTPSTDAANGDLDNHGGHDRSSEQSITCERLTDTPEHETV